MRFLNSGNGGIRATAEFRKWRNCLDDGIRELAESQDGGILEMAEFIKGRNLLDGGTHYDLFGELENSRDGNSRDSNLRHGGTCEIASFAI